MGEYWQVKTCQADKQLHVTEIYMLKPYLSKTIILSYRVLAMLLFHLLVENLFFILNAKEKLFLVLSMNQCQEKVVYYRFMKL